MGRKILKVLLSILSQCAIPIFILSMLCIYFIAIYPYSSDYYFELYSALNMIPIILNYLVSSLSVSTHIVVISVVIAILSPTGYLINKLLQKIKLSNTRIVIYIKVLYTYTLIVTIIIGLFGNILNLPEDLIYSLLISIVGFTSVPVSIIACASIFSIGVNVILYLICVSSVYIFYSYIRYKHISIKWLFFHDIIVIGLSCSVILFYN